MAWSQQPWCCCDPHSMRSSSYLEHLIYHLWGHLDRKPTDMKTLNFLNTKQNETAAALIGDLKRSNCLPHARISPCLKGSILHPLHSSFYALTTLFLDVPLHTVDTAGNSNRDLPLPRRHHTLLSSNPIANSLDASRASLALDLLITSYLWAII